MISGAFHLKKTIYQFVQYLAASTFIGISVYGIISSDFFVVYMGWDANEKVPVATSLLLGLGAVTCIVVIVVLGGVLDRIMAQEGKDEGR